MKKVIRLTESDLVRLVKRVISEQETSTHTLYVNRAGFLHGVRSAFPLVNMGANANANCKTPFTINQFNEVQSRAIGFDEVGGKPNTIIYTGNITAEPGVFSTSTGTNTAGIRSGGRPCGHEEPWVVGSPLNEYNKINKDNPIKKGDTIQVIFKTV